MNKALKKTALAVICSIFLSGALAGCHELRQEKIQSALGSSLKIIEKLDCPDDADLTGDCFDDGEAASLVRVKEWVLPSRKNGLDENQRGELMLLKSEIRRNQQDISDASETLFFSVKEINSLIKAAGKSNLPLSDKEKGALNSYAEQVKEINSVLRNSVGRVYLKLKKLRNNYTGENLSQVKEAHASAQSETSIRLDCANRLNQITAEIKLLLTNRAD